MKFSNLSESNQGFIIGFIPTVMVGAIIAIRMLKKQKQERANEANKK